MILIFLVVEAKKIAKMIINKPLVLTYLYLFIYIILSSGVILYNKVMLLPLILINCLFYSLTFVYCAWHFVC